MSNVQNEIVTIVLDDIFVDETQNVRKHYDEKSIRELTASIKANGLIQPMTVRPSENVKETDGKPWVLTAGFRRYRALRELKYERSACTVVQASAKQGTIINVVENVNRQSLTPYEMARGFVRLRDEFGMTAEEISKAIKGEGLDGKGKSKANVANLMRAYDQLHPVILDAWENRHEKATTYNLFTIMAKSQDEQLIQWEIWLGLRNLDGTCDDDENPGNGSGSKTEPVKPKCRPAIDVVSAITIVRQAIKSDEISAEDGKLIQDVLKWVLKKRATLPGIKIKGSADE